MARSLSFNENGKFKILVAADLHEWSESGDDISVIDVKKTEDTMLLLDASIKALDPDLVVFNGDNAFGDTVEEVRGSIDSIMKSVKAMNKPLAFVLGNHEHDEGRVDPQIVTRMFCEYENCLFHDDKTGITGLGNYYITIKGKDDKVKYNLWFIDSNGPTPNEDLSPIYDWVHDDQIEWYEQTSKKLAEENGGEPVPSILFQHIPVIEEYKLMREAKPFEIAKAIKGTGFFNEKFYIPKVALAGNFNEPIHSPSFNNGQFDSWKKMGDIKAAFFGHDHINDFEGYLDGILLAQCRGAGFHGYTEGDKTGIKLITINEEDLSLETKNFYFQDFGLTSKSISPIEQKLNTNKKKKIATAAALGAGAAITAAAVAVSKINKKKK